MTRTSIAVSILVLSALIAIASVEVVAQTRDPNANRAATPVIDVNEAAKKPVAYWTKIHFEGSGGGFPKDSPKEEVPPEEEFPSEGTRAVYKESEDFFVPEGHILVLEDANAVACYGPLGERMSIGIKTGYGENRTPANLKIVLEEQGVFDEPGAGVYMHAGSSQAMKIYIRGGEAFRLTAWRSGGS